MISDKFFIYSEFASFCRVQLEFIFFLFFFYRKHLDDGRLNRVNFNSYPRRLTVKWRKYWALSIQPKIPVISVGTSNGTDHFGLVRPEYSGPALKVVHCDRSGHFGGSDRNVPFHLPKLFVPSTAIFYPAYKTK